MAEPQKIVFTREDLEDMMGQRVFDWQWDRVQEFLNNKPKPSINISKEYLFTNHPDIISVIKEEMRINERNKNIKAYEKETGLAVGILRQNRYSTAPPYEWYGPDPEPSKRHVTPEPIQD